jgi:tRNA 2-thiocytidine biosynthesis protein TtcA
MTASRGRAAPPGAARAGGSEQPAAVGPPARGALRRKIARAMARAIADFDMIEDGDRILCAVSGGKDSYAMHALLVDLARRAPVNFEVLALNVDQGHPGYPGHLLSAYMERNGYPFRMVAEDTYSIVTEKIPEGKTYCSLCSRLRRGILYRLARELGCSKIALGHHRDDAVTTLMLNLVFSGQLKAMPPKLRSDAGDNVVIRPLIYCAEADLAAFAAQEGFPILPCDLCGSQENLQRKAMSRLLEELEARFPGVRRNMLAALGNVRPTHLFDRGLWSRLGIDFATDAADGPAQVAEDDLVPTSSLVRESSSGRDHV